MHDQTLKKKRWWQSSPLYVVVVLTVLAWASLFSVIFANLFTDSTNLSQASAALHAPAQPPQSAQTQQNQQPAGASKQAEAGLAAEG